MQPTLMAARDPQILQELTRAFPNSPEFVQYLRRSIAQLGGTDSVATLRNTRTVAALFIRGLKDVRGADVPMRAEIVERLSVHMDCEAVKRVDRAVFSNPSYFEDCMIFGQWIDAQINEDAIESRDGIPPGTETDYLRLYMCAYAMLVGIDIDPRHSAT